MRGCWAVAVPVGERRAPRFAPAEMAALKLELAMCAKRRPLPRSPVFGRDPVLRKAEPGTHEGRAERPGHEAAVDTGPKLDIRPDHTALTGPADVEHGCLAPVHEVGVVEVHMALHCGAERHGRAEKG